MNTTRTNEMSSYWKSVKSCLARPDGSAEIRHHNGRVETFKSVAEERKEAEEKAERAKRRREAQGGLRGQGDSQGLGAAARELGLGA